MVILEKTVSAIVRKTSKSNSTHIVSNPKAKTVTKVMDIVDTNKKVLTRENDVPKHKQRYHTKEGIKWIEKKPYHRVRKDGPEKHK